MNRLVSTPSGWIIPTFEQQTLKYIGDYLSITNFNIANDDVVELVMFLDGEQKLTKILIVLFDSWQVKLYGWEMKQVSLYPDKFLLKMLNTAIAHHLHVDVRNYKLNLLIYQRKSSNINRVWDQLKNQVMNREIIVERSICRYLLPCLFRMVLEYNYST